MIRICLRINQWCALFMCLLSCMLDGRLLDRWLGLGQLMIFWTCLISAVTCFWQGFTNTWYHLFIARFMLGFGIGIKSATVPAYAAECTPKQIRGALVMLWQFFTAFGIMLGYVACSAFYHVGDHGIGGGSYLEIDVRFRVYSCYCCFIPNSICA